MQLSLMVGATRPTLSLLGAALLAACTAPQAEHSSRPAAAARAFERHELAHLQPLIDSLGYAGTVLVRDLARGREYTVHGDRAGVRLIPASTFKIPNSLFALEAGIAADEHTVLPWDGVPHERTELHRDFTLREAFHISAVPHYQAIARTLGAERMQHFLDTLGYGNADMGGGIDHFWLDGELRISPTEQVEFLTRLHGRELPFSREAQETLVRLMESERTDAHVVRAKTGWARLPGGRAVGWWVGWVERDDDVWLFATALDAERPGPNFGRERLDITRAVLRELEVMP